MSLTDLFKTDKQRARDEAKRRRKAFRDADKALESVTESSRNLQAERDGHWNRAKDLLAGGQKTAATRCVHSVQRIELLLQKLQQKEWVSRTYLTKLRMARSDQDFASALRGITAVMDIDPEAVEDVFVEVQEKLGDQDELDKIWEGEHRRELEDIKGSLSDSIPSVESMLSDLEDEVRDGLNAPNESGAAAEGRKADADAIANLQARARKIMDGTP